MNILSNPLSALPDKFLESMAKSLTDKICETVYLDTMAGGTKPEHSRHPQREILNIVTRFLQQNIDRSVPEFDNEFKRNYINAFVAQMKEPIRKMYEDDYLCLQMAETLLLEYPHVFLNVINAFAKIVQNEPKSGGGDNTNVDAAKVFANKTMKLFLKYFENTNISVPSVDETIAKQREVDIDTIAKQFEKTNYKMDGLIQEKSKQAEVQKEIDTQKLQSDGDKADAKAPYSFITEKITSMFGTSKPQAGGFDIKQMANTMKEGAENMKQNMTKLEGESSKMMKKLGASVPSLPGLPVGIPGLSTSMTKDVIEKIFESFESTKNGRDASIIEYKEIKHTIYDTVMAALQFHLNEPEGRQMYLRQLEPLMRFYCNQMIANEDLATIQFFHLIKGSNKINALITQEMEKAFLSGNVVFDHKQSSNPVFANKIDEMYRGTFAYAVWENAKKNINELITSTNPLEKIYKDLDILKISEKIKNEKKAIDYTYTLCYDPKVKLDAPKLDAPKPVKSEPSSVINNISKVVPGNPSQANVPTSELANTVPQAMSSTVNGLQVRQMYNVLFVHSNKNEVMRYEGYTGIHGRGYTHNFTRNNDERFQIYSGEADMSDVKDNYVVTPVASGNPSQTNQLPGDLSKLNGLAGAIPDTAALQGQFKDFAGKLPYAAALQGQFKDFARKLPQTKGGGKKKNTYRKIFAQQRKTRRYTKRRK